MRQSRLKIHSAEAPAAYHCISRTVNGERIIDAPAREVLRRQIWQVADFCGVQVLTYAILANHFHVLVYVPQQAPISDAELLRRYRQLHPRPTSYQTARLDVIASGLRQGTSEAAIWRCRQLALMGDVSQYMKLLKQRFSIWFNQTHGRFGTLWAERFKSVLVEPRVHALQTLAAYIDLNAVRAGLVSDPKDYRFCGYAEAVGGSERARSGLARVVGGDAWTESQAAYRQLLYGLGARPRAGACSIRFSDFERVMREGGELSVAAALRCRWRHFSAGAILGGQAFVARQAAACRARFSAARELVPRPLPEGPAWGDLFVMRGLRSWAGPRG